ncbi:MAG: pyrB [Clostridiales bacterium]|jgi:aspartate carbamoyltransferase catalytic subunit|nr:pyrB [Clostridiales bacterium]
MFFNQKHLLDLKSLDAVEINYILNSSEKMKYILQSTKGSKRSPVLKGKTVATLFYDTNSSSRISFDLAAQNLSADIVHLKTSEKFSNGDTLRDIGRTIDQMGVDYIVLHHPYAGGPHYLASYVEASVINAGDGENENPTQALIDLLTIKEIKHSFEGLKVVIVGDIKHNRVAKSDIWALTKMGANVSVVGPPTLIPTGLDKLGVGVFYDIEKAVVDADVIMTLKLQPARQENSLISSINEYVDLFKLDAKRLSYAKEDAIVIHPGAISRGVEISSTIIDGKSSLVDKQFINGVAVRMAVFHLLGKGGLNFYENTHKEL